MDQLAAAGGRREPVSSYGKREYWQQRYAANSAPLEWFVSLADVLHDVPTLAQLLSNRAGKRARVLELGCGTSSLAAELWDLGFRDVVAVDYDEQAIAAQRARQQPTQRQVDYRVMGGHARWGDWRGKVDFSLCRLSGPDIRGRGVRPGH